jgi:hypothetical protein
MDASAIIQNDVSLENLRAMTDATLEYGVYGGPPALSAEPPASTGAGMPDWLSAPKVRPGICRRFEEKLNELPPLSGDPEIVRGVWEDLEGLAYLYIWHLVLSF